MEAKQFLVEFVQVCVFITAGPMIKLFAGGGGGEWRTCAMREDEPRPVWMGLLASGILMDHEPCSRRKPCHCCMDQE